MCKIQKAYIIVLPCIVFVINQSVLRKSFLPPGNSENEIDPGVEVGSTVLHKLPVSAVLENI